MFQNKLIVITGGSSGLGEALAKRFIKKGAHLALIARDRNKLQRVQDMLRSMALPTQRIEIFSCDVADEAAAEQTFNAIVASMSVPDILINSAGILKEGYFEKLPFATFRNVMDINYFGLLNCTRAVLPHFKHRGSGRIVNIASLGGKMGSFGYAAYCSSKFAVVGLTETLRAELKFQNIKVQLVCPGEFESPMVAELNTYRTAENRVMTQTVPVMHLDDVANEILSGIRRGSYLIIPGRIARLMEMGTRFFPGISRAIADLRIKMVYQGPKN